MLFKYLFGSAVEKGKYRKVPCWISLTWGSPMTCGHINTLIFLG